MVLQTIFGGQGTSCLQRLTHWQLLSWIKPTGHEVWQGRQLQVGSSHLDPSEQFKGVLLGHTHFCVTGSQIWLGGQMMGVVVPVAGQAHTLGLLSKVP